MSFHQQLLDATHSQREGLLALPIFRAALAGQIGRDDYAAFLQQAYHHVRHTTPLLMACGSRLPARLEWLRTAVAEYIEEELGHQEWILDDLVALGVDRELAASSRPWASTELMVAYAYDGIQRGNPAAFFGMVLVLEGTSVALATRAADIIEQSLGLPRNAFSYLRSHGDLDQQHTRFYADLMDRIDEPGDRAAIIHAAQMFYRLYGDIFRELDARRCPIAEAA